MRTADGQKDPIMRLIRELQTEQGRIREGLFVAEGEELVRRAFDYGAQVVGLVLSDKLANSEQGHLLAKEAERAGAEVCTASPGLIGKMLGSVPPPDRVAIVQRRVVSLESVLNTPRPLFIAVENGENADNLGMLLRSADAAGVDGVILLGTTTDPFAKKAVRASRGAVFGLPICICADTLSVVAAAKDRGVLVAASSARAQTVYTEADLGGPVMLAVGNEHVGISDELRSAADLVLRIPMRGRVNSLNIAVAASILMYEALRQRGGGK